MQLVGVLNVATVDEHGAPQIRCISAVHYDEDSLYFFTARGKNVAKELLADGRVQILVYTKFKEMIRLSGKALPVADERQKRCIDAISYAARSRYRVFRQLGFGLRRDNTGYGSQALRQRFSYAHQIREFR